MSQPPSPSGEPAARAGGRLDLKTLNFRSLAVIVAALAVFRLVIAGSVHLTEDEAYYRLWSLFPQAGYFDHPPMVAWWIAIGRALVGDNALGARLLPVLGSALTAFVVFDCARLAGSSERTAARAALWYNATFLIGAGALLAIPDAGATLFWSLTLWCALKARRHDDGDWRRAAGWWVLAGVAAGLATLSKYSALFMAPGILIWLLSDEPGRRQLRRVGPWLAMLAAGALFAINVGWNAGHGWVSFTKQFGRVGASHFKPGYVIELIVAQLVLLNPLVTSFVIRAVIPKFAGTLDGAARPFLLISAAFLAYLVVHAFHDRVQAHWPAPVYPALATVAAMAAAGVDPAGLMARLRAATPWVGLGLTSLVLLHLALPGTDIGSRVDPTLQLRRWPDFAGHIEAIRRQNGAAWVGAISYGTAAQLSDEPAIQAPVLQINERERYAFVPSKTLPDLTRPGLIVDIARRVRTEDLEKCFAVVQPLPEADRGSSKGPDLLYAVVLVDKPRRLVGGGCALAR